MVDVTDTRGANWGAFEFDYFRGGRSMGSGIQGRFGDVGASGYGIHEFRVVVLLVQKFRIAKGLQFCGWNHQRQPP